MEEWKLVVMPLLVAVGYFFTGVTFERMRGEERWQKGFDAARKIFERTST